MILIDASQLMEGSRDQDFFSMKLLSYLSELSDDPRRRLAPPAGGIDPQQGRSVRTLL